MTAVETTTRKTARKAKGDGHLRRAEILEAAERIFVAEGYEGATIRKIADEVGVSSTALYMHFQDKACILMEICEQTFSELLARNAEIAARPVDPVVRTRMMLEAYTRWGLQHPNAYQLVYCTRRPPTAEPLPHATAEISQRCYDVFAGVVREIAATGRLRTGDGCSAAQALWLSCHGVVAMISTRPNFAWADHDELIQVTLDGLLNGLVID
jgi:AcrR family transcriptional regulator